MKFRFSAAYVVLGQKAWQALAGVITALLVTRFLSLEQQGFYFAIGSLLSAFLLIDLGLSGLLVQLSARMFPGLAFDGRGGLHPEGTTKRQFVEMLGWCRRWYGRASILALGLLPLGYLYFSSAVVGAGSVRWQFPWAVAVVCAAFSLAVLPAQSVVEGSGRVAEVYGVRLAHYTVGAASGWFLLASGHGLLAPAMAPLAVAGVTSAWVALRYRGLLADLRSDSDRFPWRQQVWPLQKRVAISWVSNYVFLNLPTLLVFYFVEAGAAGRLGLSIAVGNLLGSMCASWLIAKVPQITQMAAQGQRVESRVLFLREFKRACWLMAAGYALFVLLVIAGSGLSIVERLLTPSELAVLFAVFVVFHSVAIMSAYFRAIAREAMAAPLLQATLLALILALWTVQGYGVTGVLGSFLAGYVCVCVPAMVLAWRGAREH